MFKMSDIIVKPIGYIASPFKSIEEIPPQSVYAKEKVATIKLMEEYKEGLKDLENYSHIIVQFYFHQSKGYELLTLTPWSDERKGVFATRSPKRPNPIGISIVKLRKIEGCHIEIEGVDMLDQTPVIDIKPYVAKLNPENME